MAHSLGDARVGGVSSRFRGGCSSTMFALADHRAATRKNLVALRRHAGQAQITRGVAIAKSQ